MINEYKSSCDIFFFFQAEDGIRDIGVTGVQTCALPILADEAIADDLAERGVLWAPDFVANAGGIINISVELEPAGYDPARSEERRVGKECRSRWSPYH